MGKVSSRKKLIERPNNSVFEIQFICKFVSGYDPFMENIARKRQKSAGDDQSTLTLKLMGRESSEVRNRGYQWPHQVDLGPTKTYKKTIHSFINIK